MEHSFAELYRTASITRPDTKREGILTSGGVAGEDEFAEVLDFVMDRVFERERGKVGKPLECELEGASVELRECERDRDVGTVRLPFDGLGGGFSASGSCGGSASGPGIGSPFTTA